MPPRDSDERLHRRIDLLYKGCIFFFLVLAVLFWYLQIIKNPIYDYLSKNNAISTKQLIPERGLILDRNHRVLVKNQASFKLLLHVGKTGADSIPVEDAIQAVRKWVDFDEAKALAKAQKEQAFSGRNAALLAEDLSLEELARVEARSLELPNIMVNESLVRYCPNGSLGAHILGYVSEASRRELKSARFKKCSSGDIVGKAGVEYEYDGFLRGRAGWMKVQVNNRGRTIRAVDNPRVPVEGNDIVLTLDLDLMIAAQKAFKGRKGAVVALDPRTGEVLVTLSFPAFDPNMFYSKASRKQWGKMAANSDNCMFNRAIQAREPPGSVFKLVVAAAGLETGVATPDRKTFCGGRTRIHGETRACWRAIGHGETNLYNALVHSCNVFFYHLGKDVGIRDMAKYARMFGLGGVTGIDLPGENPGLIPDPAWKRKRRREAWFPGETISVSIGQGAVGVTPLQVANLTAAFATGGRIYKPHLLKSILRSNGEVVQKSEPQLLADLKLKRSTFDAIRRGMWGVVNDRGTGTRAGDTAYEAAGKTGTAQVVGQRDGNEGPNDHAWFTGFAPFDKPEIVVTVLVENGGHGGEAAAPVAGAVMRAYWNKHHGSDSGPNPTFASLRGHAFGELESNGRVD